MNEQDEYNMPVPNAVLQRIGKASIFFSVVSYVRTYQSYAYHTKLARRQSSRARYYLQEDHSFGVNGWFKRQRECRRRAIYFQRESAGHYHWANVYREQFQRMIALDIAHDHKPVT